LEVSDHYPVEVDLKANHRYLMRHELWNDEYLWIWPAKYIY